MSTERYFKVALSYDDFQRLRRVATDCGVSVRAFAEVAVMLAVERAEQFNTQPIAPTKELT